MVNIEDFFKQSAQLKLDCANQLSPQIVKAAKRIIQSLEQGGTILACGNGGSACDAQHFSSELVNRFETERTALPAITLGLDSAILTSVANDSSFEKIFSRQIQALGKAGDVLLAISTSGTSANIVEAVLSAKKQNMAVVALSGRDGGRFPQLLDHQDIEIRVPSSQTARIQEVHILVIHCLCSLVDEHYQF